MVRQGEVYWWDDDEPRGSGPGYRRPWMVVQNDVANSSPIATTVMVVLTSNRRLAGLGGNVLVPARISGLPRDSVAVVSQIQTFDKRFLLDLAAVIPSPYVRRIADGVQRLVEPRSPP